MKFAPLATTSVPAFAPCTVSVLVSATTARICLPRMPPAALKSSIAIIAPSSGRPS